MSEKRDNADEAGEGRQPYERAAHFAGPHGERDSRRAYKKSRDEIYEANVDLSVFRFVGKMGLVGWCVALIGERPPEDLERKLGRHLDRGAEVALPQPIAEQLRERRRQIAGQAPWVEGRYGKLTGELYRRPKGGC